MNKDQECLHKYLRKVFSYLAFNGKQYMTPLSLFVALKAQAFRFKHINLKKSIESAFELDKIEDQQIREDKWSNMRIDY